MARIPEATKEKLASLLYDHGLLKFGEFTLKSGIRSPFYIDLRKAQSHPAVFHAITDVYGEMVDGFGPSVLLAGIPEAATPLAAAVGYKLERPLIQPRKVVKDHGTKKPIEGEYEEGDSVVLIDDLITKGDSKVEAIEQLEAAGLKVVKLIVLVDRQQGGTEAVAEAGYDVEAAFTITELLDVLVGLGKLDKSRYDEVREFIATN